MNLILASHGTLCEGFANAFGMLAGSPDALTTVSLDENGIDDFRSRLTAAVNAAQGPTLVLTDLFGGTPYNEAFALFLQQPERLRVVAGMNLPMVVELGVTCLASDDLDAAVQTALTAGQSGVVAAELPETDDSLEDDDLF